MKTRDLLRKHILNLNTLDLNVFVLCSRIFTLTLESKRIGGIKLCPMTRGIYMPRYDLFACLKNDKFFMNLLEYEKSDAER